MAFRQDDTKNMFLPLHDQNPLRVIPFQLVTFSIIVLCVVVFLFQQVLQGEQEQAFSVVLWDVAGGTV